jgi:hypothetical protein
MALPMRRRTLVRGVLGKRHDEDDEKEEPVEKATSVNTSNVPRFPRRLERQLKESEAAVDPGEVDVSDLKRRLSAKKSSPKVSVDEIEEVYEEAEEPKVVAKSSKKTSDSDEEEDAFDGFSKDKNNNYPTFDEEPVVEHEKAVLRKKGANPIVDILEHMKIGTILVIVKEDRDSWKVTQTDKFFTSLVTPTTTGARLKGKSFWDAVSNPEYQQWSREWNQLTFSEKQKRAEKMGVTWEESKNPKIEAMNITKAVREHLGIEKYRDEYKSRAARANIKGH